ncbi:hypothetical protein [Streptomyces sp. NPDC050856]|uniref:hypothetical protein n=1 Tax=unclassified Streptomyces TaxID=2593676 RepID=UPI0033CAB482
MTIDATAAENFDPEDREPTVDLTEETPEADAAEQHTELRQRGDDPLTRIDPDVANEADAAEQARVVELDEDDYR